MEFGRIPEIDVRAEAAAVARWNALAKPVGSLGELERLIVRMAGIRGTADVRAARRKIAVFCADNGVTAEGICGSDPALTAVIAANIAAGRGNVSAMAAAVNCEVLCVDVGMFSPGDGVIDRRVRAGTRNFAKEPAMTPAEAEAAILVGRTLAEELAADGADILLAGEAGIGNTTTAAAVAAALLDLPANAVVGRGAGLGDEGLARKVRVIDEALDKYGFRRGKPDASGFTHGTDAAAEQACHSERSEESHPNCTGTSAINEILRHSVPQNDRSLASDEWIFGKSSSDAFRILCCVGGLDIASMAGFYIGCANARVPVILDGAISAAAALLAERLAPGTRQFLLASHLSREPMAAYLLEKLGLSPILRAGLALGEGTGGICLLPMIDLALAAYNNAATFAESGLAVSREEGHRGQVPMAERMYSCKYLKFSQLH